MPSGRDEKVPATETPPGLAPVTLRLPFAPASVSVARQRLRAWMVEQGATTENVEDARLIVSELVGNSVRHARPLPDGSLTVAWLTDRRGVQISVTDGGAATRPRTLQATSSALAGRGMSIVETLAQNWWSERSDTRTTVYALLAI